jgi:hypothetical protein
MALTGPPPIDLDFRGDEIGGSASNALFVNVTPPRDHRIDPDASWHPEVRSRLVRHGQIAPNRHEE